jgi:hypothetical protein
VSAGLYSRFKQCVPPKARQSPTPPEPRHHHPPHPPTRDAPNSRRVSITDFRHTNFAGVYQHVMSSIAAFLIVLAFLLAPIMTRSAPIAAAADERFEACQ